MFSNRVGSWFLLLGAVSCLWACSSNNDSITATGGSSSVGGSTSAGASATGGTTVATGGASAATGGTTAATGGTTAATGGTSAATGGASSTGGTTSTLTPVQQACKALCALHAASTLNCKSASCENDCSATVVYADFPDEFLAMIQCEATSLTPADFYCSDWALWPASMTGLAPTVIASPKSACFDEICASTCDESSYYDGNVCVACGCRVC